MRYGALLAIVQLAVGCSPSAPDNGAARQDNASAPAPAKAAPQGEERLVVAFGDSLYAGYGLEGGEGFAPALERALAAQGIRAKVVNAGVSGDTSAAGLARFDFTMDGLASKPDLVIVGLGGNDMLRGLPPEETRANLDAILKRLKERGVPAMLTGMLASPNLGADYGATFNGLYADLARQYDAPLYPFFLDGVLGRRDMMLPDGIHPNAQGVESITAKVAPLVAARLKELK